MEEKSKSKINNALNKYQDALDKYQKAQKTYDELKASMGQFKNQIKHEGYYSSSGIKIDMPFLASSDSKAKIMMQLLGVIKGRKAADLGCGDGKLLLYLLKKGASAEGFELEPKLIKEAHVNLQRNGCDCLIHQRNFLKSDLSKYEVITLYGTTSMMARLEEKLSRELKSGTKIVSNTFIFPNWQPIKKRSDVYLYLKS